MAKFYGAIGFSNGTKETTPGVWEDEIIERKYYGDLNRISHRFQTTDKVNDDITINSELSIVADLYAFDHFYAMRYAEFMGAKWKITNVDASQRPRLILTLGGLYNGEQT